MIKKEKRWPLMRGGLLTLFVVIFLLVGVACGEKETEPKSAGKTPEVVTPETLTDEETGKEESEPVESKDDEDLTEKELQDLFKSGKEIDELYYTMELKGYGEEPIVTKVWLKGEKMRFESEVMGQTVINIMDEEAFYSISVNEKIAMKMPTNNDENLFEDIFSLDDVTNDVDGETFSYLGKETVHGEPCLVVESNDDEVGTLKMWLHEKYGIAMKVETAVKDQEGSYMMEVTDFNVDGVSDDVFQVPDGYEIMDFGDLEFPMGPDAAEEP